MWDIGLNLSKTSTEVYSKKQYGKEYWDEFLDTHHYWFVEWKPNVKRNVIPISYIHTPTQDRYNHQVDKFGYNGSWEDYKRSCSLIDRTLKSFDYQTYNLWNDSLFRNKEFGQLVILNRELYEHGAFNYPCYRFNNNKLTAHPGQHLSYSRLFLGLDFKGWISVPKNKSAEIDWIYNNTIQRIEITDDKQIEQILGTDNIAASIQRYSQELVPSLYPSIPRPIWNEYDNNGNTNWPWHDAKSMCDQFDTHPHFDLIMNLCSAQDPLGYFNNVARCNTRYFNEHIMLNNFVAFLTMGIEDDENFTLNTSNE